VNRPARPESTGPVDATPRLEQGRGRKLAVDGDSPRSGIPSPREAAAGLPVSETVDADAGLYRAETAGAVGTAVAGWILAADSLNDGSIGGERRREPARPLATGVPTIRATQRPAAVTRHTRLRWDNSRDASDDELFAVTSGRNGRLHTVRLKEETCSYR